MSRVVLDANIYVKLFKAESDSQKAKQLMNSLIQNHSHIMEPSIAISETITICEANKINVESPCDFFGALLDSVIQVIEVDYHLIKKSLDIMRIGHVKSGYPTFNDSLYHAIAIRDKAIFITADRRHYVKIKHLGNIMLLEKNSGPQLLDNQETVY